MLILGIDPGTSAIGYAAVKSDGRSQTLISADLLHVTSVAPEERLRDIHQEIMLLIKKWKPEAISVEKLFFAKNTKTAMAVSESRGVILLTSVLAGIKVFEYTPLEVKKVVTGDGKADKAQIKKMVQLTLPETRALQARDDVFDAIAIALACCFKEKMRGIA